MQGTGITASNASDPVLFFIHLFISLFFSGRKAAVMRNKRVSFKRGHHGRVWKHCVFWAVTPCFLIPEWFHPLFKRQLATQKKYIHMDTTLFSSQMYL